VCQGKPLVPVTLADAGDALEIPCSDGSSLQVQYCTVLSPAPLYCTVVLHSNSPVDILPIHLSVSLHLQPGSHSVMHEQRVSIHITFLHCLNCHVLLSGSGAAATWQEGHACQGVLEWAAGQKALQTMTVQGLLYHWKLMMVVIVVMLMYP